MYVSDPKARYFYCPRNALLQQQEVGYIQLPADILL